MVWDSPTAQPLSPDSVNRTGVVLAIQANYYQVRLDAPSPVQLLCTRRARLRKMGQQVMVGDRVQVEDIDWSGRRGAIAQVDSRRSELDRPAIANVDQILLVFSLAEPDPDPYQLSQFLVKAESTDLPICLGLNKWDLASPCQADHWQKRLVGWGYEPCFFSVYSGKGLSELLARLEQKITVVAGPSGVGKSSLINTLIPAAEQRVAQVSGKLARGRHTTRHVELFSLGQSGLIADTPGFNRPELTCPPDALANYFPEIQWYQSQANCQFANCFHRDEPGCVVRGDWERYAHYLDFLDHALAYQNHLHQRANPEQTVKSKTSEQGKIRYEPKLAPQKYRRSSRRLEQQTLQKLCQDLDF